ncbi:MAG: endonuclease V [Nitrososphaerota archaeon]|nr:endonuclease V [Nitrososphaerota archaeon]MDW8043123.1 endonuclease V [Nitrososphaerota archaeon]
MSGLPRHYVGFFELVQGALSRLVRLEHLHVSGPVRVCAADASYSDGVGRAGCVVVSLPDWRVIEERSAELEVLFPYVPGLLFLREGPLVVECVSGLREEFSVLVVNGHGVAHPRRAGLASVVGLLLSVPTVGVAGSLLVGEARWRGSVGDVVLRNEVVGRCYRTPGGEEYFVSPGHLTDLETVDELLDLTGMRLHELVGLADLIASRRRPSRPAGA